MVLDNNLYNMLKMARIKMDLRARWRVADIILLLMVALTWITKVSELFNSSFICVIWFILACLLILVLNDGVYVKMKFNLLVKFYFIYSVIFLLGAFFSYRVGSVLLGCVYLLIFPLIAVIVSDDSKTKIFLKSFFNAVIVNYVIVFFLSIIFVNAGNFSQYGGIVNNANAFSLLALVCMIAAIYRYGEGQREYRWLVIIGICIGSIFIAQSRTVIICCIFDMIIWGVYAVKKKSLGIDVKKICFTIFAAILSALAIMYFNQVMMYIIGVITETGNESIGGAFNFRMTNGFDGNGTITTGRASIWQAYLNDLTLLPHTDQAMPMIDGEVIHYSAHNTYLHLGYCFGFLCGVSYLIYNIFNGIKSLKSVCKNPDSFIYLIGFIIILNYGIATLVETLYSPITNSLCLAYFVVSVTLMFKVGEEDSVKL